MTDLPHPHRHQPGRPGPSAHAHHHDHDHRRGILGRVTGLLRPHSHDSADSVDRGLEASDRGIRAVKVSLMLLAATALLQVLVVLASGSVALLADTIHNFADALTAVPLWVAFALSRRAPSRRYTYGYGRVEDLAGLFIVAMIAVSAAVAGWEAVTRLLHPQPVEYLGWVALAGLIGFAGNELVARHRIGVGRRIGSGALVADGLHARTDGFTSLAVVAGAAGVAAGWPAADPIIGLVITVAILGVLRSAAASVFHRLLDGVDPELINTAERTLLATPGVRGVTTLHLRWLGHTLRAEADVKVDPGLSATQAHDIAHHAQDRLIRHVASLTTATIHTSPDQQPSQPTPTPPDPDPRLEGHLP